MNVHCTSAVSVLVVSLSIRWCTGLSTSIVACGGPDSLSLGSSKFPVGGSSEVEFSAGGSSEDEVLAGGTSEVKVSARGTSETVASALWTFW